MIHHVLGGGQLTARGRRTVTVVPPFRRPDHATGPPCRPARSRLLRRPRESEGDRSLGSKPLPLSLTRKVNQSRSVSTATARVVAWAWRMTLVRISRSEEHTSELQS